VLKKKLFSLALSVKFFGRPPTKKRKTSLALSLSRQVFKFPFDRRFSLSLLSRKKNKTQISLHFYALFLYIKGECVYTYQNTALSGILLSVEVKERERERESRKRKHSLSLLVLKKEKIED
tara:strand:- start:344 stop:706 length:363 start_codon:yes stop_codon:yes gene_type:complete